MVEVLRSAALAGIAHGFCTRQGGVSRGAVAGLNAGLGSDDDPAAVAENRARALAAIAPGAMMVAPYQVHSPDVLMVTKPWPDSARPPADALVTDRPGIALSILTADCAPVLLADCEAGVIGAAHAGWRGAHGGVLENTVAAMVRLGARPAHIAAAIGPTIAQVSYEVDDSFRAGFTPADARFFARRAPGKWQFDLPAYVAQRLRMAGVDEIDDLALDTYADEARFYSFRRATHRGEASYGRLICVIALPQTP